MFSVYDGPDANCVLLSRRQRLVESLFEVFLENEAVLKNVTTYEALLGAIEAEPSVNFVLIDLDFSNGILGHFDQLRQFRDTAPDKPTILLSEDFEADEYGTHRQVLGDVSLRVPVLHAALELALLQAPINNLNWIERQNVDPGTWVLEDFSRYQGEAVWH